MSEAPLPAEADLAAVLPVPFVKLHGLGNSYLYIDGDAHPVPESLLPALARRMSDPNFGVGADGIIVVAGHPTHTAAMRIFNRDGSEAEMCGNGIRGVAKYLFDRGRAGREQRIHTRAGTIGIRVVDVDPAGRARTVAVDMGEPRLERGSLPLAVGAPDEPARDLPLEVAGERLALTAVSMGNPHVVHFVPALWDAERTARVGRLVEHHPWFPARTNFHVAEVVTPEHVRIRHWERGSGLTLACGTGASAVLVAGAVTGRLARRVRADVPGGTLELEWAADGRVRMTGPAEEICAGTFALR
ncbi:MAG: diaminopimelate epimerase [Actinomycetia bacterium]|nr:diaminopimelate epimerase [Actinomycetes bacterium]